MNSGDLHKVWEVRALKRKPAADEAQKMLDKIAKQVQPIMRKHKWRVKLLCEFCPSNPRLLGLNVNGGVSVKLRLRRPNRDWDFYPYDQVLDTMLHELCHNAHGPHNANFYKLWDELRKECEELISKGITGTGDAFDLPERRLGGFSRQPPLTSLRQTAIAAAEKRAKLGSLLPSGPKRLGGDSNIMDALTPVQAAAMAAERRLQDDLWCASQLVEVSDDEEDMCDVAKDISSIGPSSGSSSLNAGRKRSREPSDDTAYQSSASQTCLDKFSKDALASEAGQVHASHSKIKSATHETYDPGMWECGICTLLNPPLAPVCKLCNTERPKDDNNKEKTWSCRFCTLENSVKVDKCCACEQWRYSYGAPMSTHTPYKGT
ncbi:DNA-dependent metalloprotease WSS1 [Linum grandiflorum]